MAQVLDMLLAHNARLPNTQRLGHRASQIKEEIHTNTGRVGGVWFFSLIPSLFLDGTHTYCLPTCKYLCHCVNVSSWMQGLSTQPRLRCYDGRSSVWEFVFDRVRAGRSRVWCKGKLMNGEARLRKRQSQLTSRVHPASSCKKQKLLYSFNHLLYFWHLFYVLKDLIMGSTIIHSQDHLQDH